MFDRIEALEGWLILLSGWQRQFVVFVAGCVTALSMPPFDLFFLPFLTFPILVWVLDGVTNEPEGGTFSKFMDGAKPGFFFGFGYFLTGLWWIGSAFLVEAESFIWALPFAVVGLPILLALFWGAATGISRLFWSGNLRRILMLAGTLALAEYTRGFVATGFPWNTLSYAVYFTPISMQSASIFGIYAMTALAVFVFALPAFVFSQDAGGKGKRIFLAAIGVTLLVAHFSYGYWRLEQRETSFVEGVNLRLMQPAIKQEDKFDPAKEAELFKRYLDLSTSSPADNPESKLSNITHLIWPESAFPFLLTERRDALAAIGAMLPEGTSLITGAARAEAGSTEASDGGLVFNSVYVVNDEGIIVSAADKVHLVPFGEYLPFQKTAERLGFEQLTEMPGGFEPGSTRKLLDTGVGPQFLPLICYEIIFSGAVRDRNLQPGWILNLTNDAWFGYTPGPFQHERQAVLRGVEEGLPVVRVANNGISGIYNAYGEPIERLALDEQGIIDGQLPVSLESTVFHQYGNAIFWTLVLLFLVCGMIPARRRF